jgi:peptidase M23-like protein
MSGVHLPTTPTDDLSDPWPAYAATDVLDAPAPRGWGDGWNGWETQQGYAGYATGQESYQGYPGHPGYPEYPGYPGNEDTGAVSYPMGDWDSGGYPAAADFHETYDYGYEAAAAPAPEPEPVPVPEPVLPPEPEPAPAPVAEEAEEPSPTPRRARGRRRSAGRPRARSAFFSVAAPSLAVLGVTAVATAATVNGSGTSGNDPAPVAAPDPSDAEPVAANREFDTQLSGLSAAVDDYANRASRTQGRIEMAEQREAEERAAEREAARREAMRPKFWLPVEQHGLSAYFGDAGINWMSLHTGIDFPVSYGTPVMAATDGYITTQWDYSYGNMAVLTAPDGTETWYAHLDSTVYTSGYVEAGTVIAYSGDSGNSTGPHLHFEVRPGGGDPIDPLPWLREHGLEPT